MIELNKIYNGDCLEYLKKMEDKSVDLCLTDFPYGVELDYDGYDDNKENLIELIRLCEPEIKRVSKFALITTGIKNLKYYRLYDWVFDIQHPNGAYFCSYGTITWQPLLVYGSEPLKKGKWTSIKSTETVEGNGHPCPKPIELWKKILMRGSANENDIVLDPFSGSGTTAVACKILKRNYICIEQSEKYCGIAQRRLQAIPEHLFN